MSGDAAVSFRPAPDAPPPPARSAAAEVMRAALAQEPGGSIEVTGPDARTTAYSAVGRANREAGRKVLRSYRSDGRMFIVRLPDEAVG